MGQAIHVAVVAASLGCVSTLLLVFMWRWCHHKKEKRNFVEATSLTRMESLQSGIAKLHHHHHHQYDHKSTNKGNNFYVFHNGVSRRGHLFNWDDHPYLVVDAVENGWSRFAFTSYKSNMATPSKRSTSTFLGACAAGEHGRESEGEISWEVCNGSAEYMQKIRLNPGLKKILHTNNSSSMSVASVIRTSLPLPGPALGNHAFPQEAYFEITILCSRVPDHGSIGKREGEKTKLLVEDGSNDVGDLDMVKDVKLDRKEGGGKSGPVMFSLGLTAGGGVPLRVPGSFPRSIGFNSNGSVFLEGMKLVVESEKAQWVGTDRVIGCGFDPRQKKVFFTLDSELVHVIHCQSEEFSTPLCPTLAANIDILVLVNFGQSAFKYAPANAQRTPNPCFISPLVNSPGATLGFDDSKELFSMGRIDSQWLNRSANKGNHPNGNNTQVLDFDESEADLFEIVLDGSEKSQDTVS